MEGLVKQLLTLSRIEAARLAMNDRIDVPMLRVVGARRKPSTGETDADLHRR